MNDKNESNCLNEVESPLFKEVAKLWMRSIRSSCKESTLVRYANQLEKHILPALGDKKISSIRNPDIIELINELNGTNGLQLSPKSVSEVLSRIRSIRSFALLNGCNVRFAPNCISIGRNDLNVRVLSFEEEITLLNYTRGKGDLTCLGIVLSLFSGIRIGELCALTWNDISIPDRQMSVCRTMQRLQKLGKGYPRTYIHIDKPKSNHSIRTIPLPEPIVEMLDYAYTKDSYILTGMEKKFVEPRTMENRFKAILRTCNIADASFHVLRHTFATRCVEAGFDIKSLSEILGHSNVNITLNRYVHPSMKTKRDNMDKLSGLFNLDWN